MNGSVQERLVMCFQLVFPFLDPENVRSARRGDLSEWDSLAELSLITTIEEEFNVELSDDAIDGLDSFAAADAAVTLALT